MVAPLLIPKVNPPTPKKNTKNRPLNKPEEMPRDLAMPPITPPSHLSEECLFIRVFVSKLGKVYCFKCTRESLVIKNLIS